MLRLTIMMLNHLRKVIDVQERVIRLWKHMSVRDLNVESLLNLFSELRLM